jgi:pimeloyl-ACP methyl ester carboxylesterase
MTYAHRTLVSLATSLVATIGASTAQSQTTSAGHYAKVNGINMYYELHGAGEPLVLLHGGGSTISTTFGRILPMLAKTHRIVAVELQAHGHTGDRNAPESFQQDADDVAELLKQLNIAKADIFGFSNGGSTALQIAIRHPDRVNRVIAASAIYKRDGMRPEFWGFMEKGGFNDMPRLYKDAFMAINHDSTKLHAMHDKDRERMLGFKDWNVEDVQSIKAPVLVVVSDQDVVRVEHAVEMAHVLPHGRLAVFLGSHGEFLGEAMSPHPNSKVPQLFVAMLEEFLAAPAP